MELTIESQRDGDEEQRVGLQRQAFGGTRRYDPAAPLLAADRVVCAYVGDRMVGSATTLEHTLWWRGRPVPCGGVGGVVVLPEVRGEGVARRLIAESFARMSRRGEVISTLYPTTATLYRSRGYEAVGWYTRRRIPLDEVPVGPAAELRWRRVLVGDPVVKTLHDRMGTDIDGWVQPDRLWWAWHVHDWEKDTSTNRFVYVGSRHGEDVAAVHYTYVDGGERLYDLEAQLLVGADGPAVAAALGFLGRNATAASSLVTVLPAALLALHLPHVQRSAVVSDWPWMLRLVDVPGAIAARGFPTLVHGSIDLDVVDEHLPANAGAHVLTVQDGHGEMVRGGSGRITVDVTDLARIYAGNDVRALAAAGRLPGATQTDLDLLSSWFVASTGATLFY